MTESTAIRSIVSKNSTSGASGEALLLLLKRSCLTLRASGETFFLADQVQKRLETFLSVEEGPSGAPVRSLKRTLRGCSEIMLDGESAYAVLRPGVGLKEIVCIHPASEKIETIDRGAYLLVRDAFVQGCEEAEKRGLVLEAVACGLPVVVTCYGGPAEFVVSGESGVVQDPNDHERFAGALDTVVADGDVWRKYAANGIQRVHDAFAWGSHARKFLRIATVHAYWNLVDVMNRQTLDRYIHTLYHTVYRPRAQALVEAS